MRNQNKPSGQLRKILVDAQSSKVKKRKYFISAILTFLFFLGIFLTILEIYIYRNTLIVWTIPTLVWISSGLLLTPFTSNLLRVYYDIEGIILQLFFNIVTFGGIICYIFMGLNYYFPIGSEKAYQVEIIKTGTLAKGRNGCGNQYAEVKLKGKDKELVFPCGFELSGNRSVSMTVKLGLLGFDIITGKTVIK